MFAMCDASSLELLRLEYISRQIQKKDKGCHIHFLNYSPKGGYHILTNHGELFTKTYVFTQHL